MRLKSHGGGTGEASRRSDQTRRHQQTKRGSKTKSGSSAGAYQYESVAAHEGGRGEQVVLYEL